MRLFTSLSCSEASLLFSMFLRSCSKLVASSLLILMSRSISDKMPVSSSTIRLYLSIALLLFLSLFWALVLACSALLLAYSINEKYASKFLISLNVSVSIFKAFDLWNISRSASPLNIMNCLTSDAKSLSKSIPLAMLLSMPLSTIRLNS